MEPVSMSVQQRYEKVPTNRLSQAPRLYVERRAVDTPEKAPIKLAHISAFLNHLAATETGIDARSIDESSPPNLRLRYDVFNYRHFKNGFIALGSTALARIVDDVPSLAQPFPARATELHVDHRERTNESYISLNLSTETQIALLEEEDAVAESISRIAGKRLIRVPDVQLPDMRIAFADESADREVIDNIQKSIGMALPLEFTLAPVHIPEL